MAEFSRDAIFDELRSIVHEIRDDSPSLVVTEDTGLFRDLGFESIDAVFLGSTLEEHYNTPLPFPEFLTFAREQQLPDISIGLLLDFLLANVNGARAKGAD